jgi:hypothetical protein
MEVIVSDNNGLFEHEPEIEITEDYGPKKVLIA